MKHILLILSLVALAAIGYSQVHKTVRESSYILGKETKVEKLLPGAGTLKGNVYILHEKVAIPLAFVDVENGKQVQADKKGYFELELDTGTYNIKISSVGYKDLIIKDFTIKWGKQHYIAVSLAASKGFEKSNTRLIYR